jgi:hypothetical protein
MGGAASRPGRGAGARCMGSCVWGRGGAGWGSRHARVGARQRSFAETAQGARTWGGSRGAHPQQQQQQRKGRRWEGAEGRRAHSRAEPLKASITSSAARPTMASLPVRGRRGSRRAGARGGGQPCSAALARGWCARRQGAPSRAPARGRDRAAGVGGGEGRTVEVLRGGRKGPEHLVALRLALRQRHERREREHARGQQRARLGGGKLGQQRLPARELAENAGGKAPARKEEGGGGSRGEGVGEGGVHGECVAPARATLARRSCCCAAAAPAMARRPRRRRQQRRPQPHPDIAGALTSWRGGRTAA